MAFDRNTRQIILFGGYDNTQVFDDTWAWNGATWTQLHPATTPPARWNEGMVYDPSHRQIVMFGGEGLNDTWVWDGSDWIEQHPTTSPPFQYITRMAYEASTRTVTLLGFAGSWTWNGTNWTRRRNRHSPESRDVPGFARAGRQILLYGGARNCESCGYLGDTWMLEGRAWIKQDPQSKPPVTAAMGMAYDNALGRTVMFGGYTYFIYLNTTWLWDGSTWTEATPALSPDARSDMAMTYDPVRRQVVMFGGWTCCYNLFGDTWTWDGTTWTEH
jgi:hypothetical protein